MTFREFWKSRFAPKGPRFECRLRQMREAAGFTEAALAEFCQVSQETITLVEAAKYEPSVVLAEHIARRLDTTVENLFTVFPATPARSADWEERLNKETRQVGYWTFYGVFAISAIGAAVLLNFSNQESVAYTLFAVAIVSAIAYVIGTTRIPGYRQFSRQWMLAGTTKRKRLLGVIAGAVIYAVFMELFANKGETVAKRIESFLFYAVIWGTMMYWLNYRKAKRKQQ